MGMNKKIVKNNSKIYTFEGKNLVVTDVTVRPEYIELLNDKNRLESELFIVKEELEQTRELKNKLKDRLNEIEEYLNQINKIGLIDYVSLNLVRKGE